MEKAIYSLKTVLFLIQFYVVFWMIEIVLQIGIVGYLFLFMYSLYIIKILFEMLSKKMKYKNDIVYNLMQIGLIFYISVITFKSYYMKMTVIDSTVSYFTINYIIVSLLILFILIYSFSELKNRKSA